MLEIPQYQGCKDNTVPAIFVDQSCKNYSFTFLSAKQIVQ